ncbi:hypothetical protein R52603_00798 [Paraburkholderia saeva]|uniref:Uncharacterized protein n=1 Tax=Paraburkholderia saeva TaxID=2777537 RepID=A0A9N8X425_9BURK|nr:hypothetical protein R52603_00798 [Paraburkholderia saeva]CAG4893941.1 hypothetical protein R70241_01682 [Paraburkholderia saeva]CAG4916493.1 hypothetical protein LMG31841_04581 [Paraburkholderia saeva]
MAASGDMVIELDRLFIPAKPAKNTVIFRRSVELPSQAKRQGPHGVHPSRERPTPCENPATSMATMRSIANDRVRETLRSH